MLETYLSDDNKVCPTILDASVVETTLGDSSSIILDSLREHISHAFARLDCLELAHARGPFRMSKERTGENACPRSDPGSSY